MTVFVIEIYMISSLQSLFNMHPSINISLHKDMYLYKYIYISSYTIYAYHHIRLKIKYYTVVLSQVTYCTYLALGYATIFVIVYIQASYESFFHSFHLQDMIITYMTVHVHVIIHHNV